MNENQGKFLQTEVPFQTHMVGCYLGWVDGWVVVLYLYLCFAPSKKTIDRRMETIWGKPHLWGRNREKVNTVFNQNESKTNQP